VSYLPFKQFSIVSSIDTSVDKGIARAKSNDGRARVVSDGHVGGREVDIIDYLIRCSACRDFIRVQNRNKFAMVMRVRNVRTKGLLAVVDMDARNIGMSRLAHVINDGGKRARGDALIRAAWHASAMRAVAKRNMSADSVCDRDGVVKGFTVEGHLPSILALRRRGKVRRWDINDVRLMIRGGIILGQVFGFLPQFVWQMGHL